MSDSGIVLAPPPREADPENPWRDDLLRARGVATSLDRCVKALINGGEGAVVALNGGYGTGKTFLLERWLNELKSAGQVAVYYNAWENDGDEDPLVSLVELIASDDKLSHWLEGSKEAVNQALSGLTRATMGMSLDVRAIFSAGDGKFDAPLDSRKARRDCQNSLRKHLEDMVDHAREGGAPAGAVVVVDELDRCRPAFAMALLERIKHILNVPGIVFVFGVDWVSLREFVKVVYGDIDAAGYLLRMFTMTLNMPDGIVFDKSSASDRMNAWLGYLRRLVERHGSGLDDAPQPLRAELEDALHNLALAAQHGGFTPREMENVMRSLVWTAWLSWDLAPERREYRLLPDVMVPMVIAKAKDHDAYYRMASRPNGAPAVIDCLVKLIDEDRLTDYDRRQIDNMEMSLYRACHPKHASDHAKTPLAYAALKRLAEGQELTDDERQSLSSRAARMDKERAGRLFQREVDDRVMDKRGGGTYLLDFGIVQGFASRIDSVWAPDA